ncbi:MAG TPA: PPOX class F420-dependent oxidoreductase [Candidatus Nitrosotenuis sp.]|nr:PPOX class F420-dependent oxidoreductase [Candidatus Nitrosotenuis sp.]
MSSDKIAQLAEHKYVNLETYKKNGQPVRTPVWFVINDGQIFVTTRPDTGKVKRLKNNQAVKIMPCGMKGESKGEWISGTARFANDSESENAVKLRNKRYGMRAKLVGMFAYRGIKPVVIAIQV